VIAVSGLCGEVIERGAFRLHNVLQPTGQERYEIARDGESLLLTSSFENPERRRSPGRRHSRRGRI